MIITSIKKAKNENKEIHSPTGEWKSVRLLLKGDNMGFSFHITTIFKDADFYMHYQNHLESVYCISGRGEITDLAKDEVHKIEPGTVYALNEHDRHRLHAIEEMELACVFNPPLSGKEVHNKEGSYDVQ
ncbi:MAG: ectoine synthase [Spirochaetaceae bacterium]|jgi:L-ectoine synthase|nr:ectoine synthase [Spirochaetaceae bacterium]